MTQPNQNPLQQFIKSLNLQGNPLSNAWEDVRGIGQGLARSTVLGAQKVAQTGHVPQMGDLAISMAKGTVDEFGNLIGLTNYKDAPLLDPNKSIFEPGGINTQGYQKTFANASTDPRGTTKKIIGNAIQHAWDKPVTTALDLFTLKQALKGRGKPVERVSVEPKVPESAVKSFMQKYTVPTKRAGMNDLNVPATSEELLKHVQSGMKLDNIEAVPEQVTGRNGIISQMTRDAVAKIPDDVPMGNAVKVAEGVLNKNKTLLRASNFDINDVLNDMNAGMPTGKLPDTMSAPSALEYARQLEEQAAFYARQSTALTPRPVMEVLSEAYSKAADNIMSQVDKAAAGKSIDAIKTPQNLSQLNSISPRLAQQVASAKDVSELRSTAAPFVRFSKMAGLSEQAGNSAFMKLAGESSRPIIGPATIGGAGVGSMFGPVGTAAGGAIGNIIDKAAAPLYDAIGNKIAQPIQNFATNTFLNAPQTTSNLGTGVAAIAPSLPAITGSSGNNGGSNLPSTTASLPTSVKKPVTQTPTVLPSPMTITEIPQSINDIKPDTKGNYQVANPFTIPGRDGSTLALSSEAYQSQIQQLNQMKADPQYINNPYFKNNVDQQISSLNSKQQISSELGTAFNTASSMNDIMTEARQLMQSAPVDILSSNASYDKLKKAFNGKYAQLAQDLDMIQKAFPGVSLYGQTKESALSTLNGANQKMLNAYYKVLNQYTGGQTPAQQPVTVQSQLPPVSSTPVSDVPQGFKWSGGDAPPVNNLPAIQ